MPDLFHWGKDVSICLPLMYRRIPNPSEASVWLACCALLFSQMKLWHFWGLTKHARLPPSTHSIGGFIAAKKESSVLPQGEIKEI